LKLAQPDKGIRLQNIILPSCSFKESVAFYRDTPGLEVIHEGAGYCFLKAGAANIKSGKMRIGGIFLLLIQTGIFSN